MSVGFFFQHCVGKSDLFAFLALWVWVSAIFMSVKNQPRSLWVEQERESNVWVFTSSNVFTFDSWNSLHLLALSPLWESSGGLKQSRCQGTGRLEAEGQLPEMVAYRDPGVWLIGKLRFHLWDLRQWLVEVHRCILGSRCFQPVSWSFAPSHCSLGWRNDLTLGLFLGYMEYLRCLAFGHLPILTGQLVCKKTLCIYFSCPFLTSCYSLQSNRALKQLCVSPHGAMWNLFYF